MNEHADHSYRDFFAEYPDVVSVDDVSRMLNICKHKVYALLRSGQMHSVRIGHVYRIPKKAVFRYMDAA